LPPRRGSLSSTPSRTGVRFKASEVAHRVQGLRIRVVEMLVFLLRSRARRFLSRHGPMPLQLDSLVPLAESDITALKRAAQQSGFFMKDCQFLPCSP
jgi:hypothetical protein